MDRPKAYICLVWLVGVASAQTGQQGLTRPTPAVLVTPATNRAQLEPVILTRASLDEESPFSPSFIAETQKLDVHAKGLDVASGSPTTVQLAGLMKAASFDPPRAIDGKSTEVLDRLLDRQKRAPLPVLYGQRPGEIEPGPRIKAGVSEVLDEGNEVVVLFSAVN